METLKVPGLADTKRGQLKSKSLENLTTDFSSTKHEKSIYGNSLSPQGHILHGLKRRLLEGFKLSKSNQDVTTVPTIEDNRGKLFMQSSSASAGMEKKPKEDKSRSSLKLDGRKRSKTLIDSNHNGNGQAANAHHEQLSVQTSFGDGNISRARSFTGESTDHFVLVDTISIDDSVDGNIGPYDAWDDPDGGPPDNERTSHEIERLKLKIKRTRNQLVEMQNANAENVQEFLESANLKNKLNFEKRQQKTNANIQHMQRKLDKYQKTLKDLEERGVSQRSAKEMLRGVHVAVKAGASTISEAVSKPIESMNKLMKKDKRVGSADNLGTNASPGDGSSTHIDDVEPSYFTNSDDDTSSISSATNNALNASGSLYAHSVNNQSCASELERIQNQNNQILQLRKENEELKETVEKLREQLVFVAEDERLRHEDLQVQFRELFNQYNDLTELHQQEIMEVKEELYKAADRIDCVDYRSAERAGEIEEALDSCVTRINKMELQQQHQQQQFFDGYFEGSGTAKLLLHKALSLVVSLFAIVLVIVSLVAKIISPFVSTWKRAVISLSCTSMLFLVWRNADQPLVQQMQHKMSDLALVAYEKVSSKDRLMGNVFSKKER